MPPAEEEGMMAALLSWGPRSPGLWTTMAWPPLPGRAQAQRGKQESLHSGVWQDFVHPTSHTMKDFSVPDTMLWAST